MHQPGRQSADNLAVLVTLPGQRPVPPEKLSEAERMVWQRVVATKASDWFSADTQPLLVEYCQHCIKADEIAEALGKYPAVPEGNDDDFDRWSMLMDRKEKVAKVLAMLATKMRLCQQSRYTPQAASTSVRHTAQAEGKPWEGGQSDTG